MTTKEQREQINAHLALLKLAVEKLQKEVDEAEFHIQELNTLIRKIIICK